MSLQLFTQCVNCKCTLTGRRTTILTKHILWFHRRQAAQPLNSVCHHTHRDTHTHSCTHADSVTERIHALSPGRRSFISTAPSMKEVCGWSGVSQGFVLARVQLFVSATFKANVHEHEHEASWVTSPLKSSTMVIPIIHRAQSSCRIGYTALCVCVCVRACVRASAWRVCVCEHIMNFCTLQSVSVWVLSCVLLCGDLTCV